MKWKTAAFMVLLIFTACAFAVTSTLTIMAKSPDIDTDAFGFGGGFVQPCEPIGGGPGGGGD